MYSKCRGMRRIGKKHYEPCGRMGDHERIAGKGYCVECAKREHARRDLARRQPVQATSELLATDPVCPVQQPLL